MIDEIGLNDDENYPPPHYTELTWDEASLIALEELLKVEKRRLANTEVHEDEDIICQLQQRQHELIDMIERTEPGLYKSGLLARLDEVETILDMIGECR